MTTSVLNECLLLKDKPTEKMIEYLHSINLHIFDEIFTKRDTDYNPIHAVLYILAAFSEESPLIILRQDSKTEQENICDYLQIPELYRHNFINLIDKGMRRAVTQYIDVFSGALFRWLAFAKVQYRDFEIMVTNKDFKTKAGEEEMYNYDIKEHGKCISEMERLAKKIEIVEGQLRRERVISSELDKMREWKEKKGAKVQSVGISIENSPSIT